MEPLQPIRKHVVLPWKSRILPRRARKSYLIIFRLAVSRWDSSYVSSSNFDRSTQPTDDKVPSRFFAKILFILIPHRKHFLLVRTFFPRNFLGVPLHLRHLRCAHVGHTYVIGSFRVSITDSP